MYIWETRLFFSFFFLFKFRRTVSLPWILPPFALIFLSTRFALCVSRRQTPTDRLAYLKLTLVFYALKFIQQDQLQLICLISHLFSLKTQKKIGEGETEEDEWIRVEFETTLFSKETKRKKHPSSPFIFYTAGVLVIILKSIDHQVSTRDDFNQQQGSGKIKTVVTLPRFLKVTDRSCQT